MQVDNLLIVKEPLGAFLNKRVNIEIVNMLSVKLGWNNKTTPSKAKKIWTKSKTLAMYSSTFLFHVGISSLGSWTWEEHRGFYECLQRQVEPCH
jgi:hypothetical protein